MQNPVGNPSEGPEGNKELMCATGQNSFLSFPPYSDHPELLT